MGTTAAGYPYPEPTDPIAAGADAIKALAQAVEDRRPRVYGGTAVAATSVGTTPLELNAFTIVAVPVAGRIMLSWFGRIQRSVVTDTFSISILANGSAIINGGIRPTEPDSFVYPVLTGYHNAAASAANRYSVEITRTAGTGTVTSLSGSGNMLAGIWTPT